MTYYIITEPDDPKVRRQILMRSVLKTRRKNIGTQSEYVNENPDMETFTLSLSDLPIDTSQSIETPLLVPGEKIDENNENGSNVSGEQQQEGLQDKILVETVLDD